MGQPILLMKGKEKMTVYGRHQAAIHVAEGWQVTDETISLPPPPVAQIDATDGAIKLANENGVDLATVTGSGENGRILVKDVREVLS